MMQAEKKEQNKEDIVYNTMSVVCGPGFYGRVKSVESKQYKEGTESAGI